MTRQKPTRLEAYTCLTLVIAAVIITLILGAPIQFGIIAATAVSALTALKLKYTWTELENIICQRIGKLCSTMLIMWMIGFLMGSMLYSGLLPMLVYHGFEIINPKFLYFSALMVCMLMSTMTGSSWSSAGTAGVVCMALAHGHGVNLGIMAGAVVAGSVFGDKISPMSETTNLAPACAGTNLYAHIKSQLWTTIPAISFAAVLFLILGKDLNTDATALPKTALIIRKQLNQLYTWHWSLLLPIILLLILSLRKKPPVPTMFLCGILNLILGKIVQKFNLSIGFTACINGFNANNINANNIDLHEKVSYILNRGGMTSMVSIILICFCGFAMTAILTHTGIMDVAISPLVKNLNSRWKAMLTAELATLSLAALGGISYVSTVFVGEAWKKPFLKNKMGLSCLSRTLEDVGTCCTSIIPWCSSAIFFSSTLDVDIWGADGFAPYTVLPFACPLIALILAIFNIGMQYKKDETPWNN